MSLADSKPAYAAARAPGAVGPGGPRLLTVGVEEEFLLLDPRTGHNAPVVEDVLAGLGDDIHHRSRLEFRRSMLEMVSGVCTGLPELRRDLGQLRQAAAGAAAAAGARLVAVGATPIAEPDRASTDNPRFQAIARHYGPIAHDPAVCGCHIHVGVPSRELAVEVCNHLRVWLPVVQALSVNSPLYAGADTGHDSWRSMQLERWPGLGPTPQFASVDDYDRTVASLVDSGVMLDASMVLWYARPSATYPTVEVRVADVCPTVGDTVLIAGLVRGLVATVSDDISAGRPALQTRDCLVKAAHWNAAHCGPDGMVLDLRSGRSRPGWDLVDELLRTIAPALDRHGDLDLIANECERVRRQGTGAARQRRMHARTGDIPAVLAALAEQTVGG
jgi:carboxylate-amine ligase